MRYLCIFTNCPFNRFVALLASEFLMCTNPTWSVHASLSYYLTGQVAIITAITRSILIAISRGHVWNNKGLKMCF